MKNFKGQRLVFLVIGLWSLMVCFQGIQVYGLHHIENWLMSLSLGIMFIVFSLIDMPNKEDERDRLIKYRSNFIAIVTLVVLGSVLIFLQVFYKNYINHLFTAEQMLILCISLLIIISSISRFIYYKLI